MNTIKQLSLFSSTLSLISIIFTDNNEIISLCQNYNIITLPIPNVNKYNIPIFKDLMITARQYVNASQYMYINADILCTPEVIFTARSLHKLLGETNVSQYEFYLYSVFNRISSS